MIKAIEGASDPAIQVWTLVVAAAAAVAAVAAGIIAAVSASKREKDSWLRKEQTAAYEAFAEAAWAALDEFSIGAVSKALTSPTFEGLDESRDKVAAHFSKMVDASRKIMVVGNTAVVQESARYMKEWGSRSAPAIPMSGAAHEPALTQHRFVVGYFIEHLLTLAAVMRSELGLVSWKQKRKIQKSRAELPKLPPMNFDDRDPGEARKTLVEWRVRRWEQLDEAGPDYTTDSTPWAMLNLSHYDLLQPLVAVVRKIPGAAWIAAIDSNLDSHQVDLIERDIATLVTTSGQGKTRFGGMRWVSGEYEGEQVFWWAEEDCPEPLRNKNGPSPTLR